MREVIEVVLWCNVFSVLLVSIVLALSKIKGGK